MKHWINIVNINPKSFIAVIVMAQYCINKNYDTVLYGPSSDKSIYLGIHTVILLQRSYQAPEKCVGSDSVYTHVSFVKLLFLLFHYVPQ